MPSSAQALGAVSVHPGASPAAPVIPQQRLPKSLHVSHLHGISSTPSPHTLDSDCRHHLLVSRTFYGSPWQWLIPCGFSRHHTQKHSYILTGQSPELAWASSLTGKCHIHLWVSSLERKCWTVGCLACLRLFILSTRVSSNTAEASKQKMTFETRFPWGIWVLPVTHSCKTLKTELCFAKGKGQVFILTF